MNEPKPLPSETKLVETPRVDRAASSYGDGYQIVPAEFARQLERELDEMTISNRYHAEDSLKYLHRAEKAESALASLADELRQAQERCVELEKALVRLGSMEAFKGPRAINKHDAELLARIDFARAAASGPKE